jgi:VCBS repeat-containing protein
MPTAEGTPGQLVIHVNGTFEYYTVEEKVVTLCENGNDVNYTFLVKAP